MTTVYELREGGYDDETLGVFETLELAQAAVPGAVWREDEDGEFYAYNAEWPEHRWDDGWYEALYIAEVVVENKAMPWHPFQAPHGPEYGPPLPPRCKYRQQSPQMVCSLFAGHKQEHKLKSASWTSDSLLSSGSFLQHFASDAAITTIGLGHEPYGTEREF